jgi:hypothetical protein
MGIQLWLVVALASFDLMLLAIACFQMRAHPPMNRTALIATGAGLAGFVQHLNRLSKPKEKVAE